MHHVGKPDRIPLAELVVRQIGGEKHGAATKTAQALGIRLTDVSKWKAPKEKKGFGGDIPHSLHEKILDLAKERNLDITAEDLVRGYRKVSA
jgi:hypothetical protein